MLVHIILLVIICFLGIVFYGTGTTREKNKYFLICSFLAIFGVEALRDSSVGLDTETYILGFNILSQNIVGTYYDRIAYGWEPLWKLLNVFVGLFTDDPQWFLAFSSLFILTGIAVFIYYNCEEKESAFWPVFFFITLAIIYPSTMNLLRQYCAIAILINVYELLKHGANRKKILISLLMILIAMGFHTSAIIPGIIIAFVSTQKNVKKSWVWAILALQCISPIVFPMILKIFFLVFPDYSLYLLSGHYQGEEVRLYSVLMILLRTICCLVVLFNFDPKNERNKDIYFMCVFNGIASVFMILQSQTVMAQRLGYYFEIFIIFLIPKILNRFKIRKELYYIVFLCSWAFFIFELSTGARGVVPYKFFWQ